MQPFLNLLQTNSFDLTISLTVLDILGQTTDFFGAYFFFVISFFVILRDLYRVRLHVDKSTAKNKLNELNGIKLMHLLTNIDVLMSAKLAVYCGKNSKKNVRNKNNKERKKGRKKCLTHPYASNSSL